MKDEKSYTKVVCPCCGKAFSVRILELHGKLRMSLRCPDCKRISEVSVEGK